MSTTTKNKKKLEHRAIIAQWQKESAMKASISTLKQIFYSTDDSKVREMFYGLLNDQKILKYGNFEDTLSDGYDIFIECYSYLMEMNKKGYWQLFESETVEITLSKGKKKKVSLFQGMCYKARSYIYKHGQVDFKRVYIEDLSREDKDGEKLNCYDALDGLMKVSQYYDIESERDYIIFNDFVKSLNLTTRQKHILHYRLKGDSVNEIAEKMNVKHNTISTHLKTIQEEVKKLYPESVRHFEEKRGEKLKGKIKKKAQ